MNHLRKKNDAEAEKEYLVINGEDASAEQKRIDSATEGMKKYKWQLYGVILPLVLINIAVGLYSIPLFVKLLF